VPLPFDIIAEPFGVETKLNSKELCFFNDMNSKKLIADKEHRVIFNPPRIINKSEINKVLSSINRKLD